MPSNSYSEDDLIIEPCKGCGRRSSQSWGKYCRNCTTFKPDPAEKEAFLALCERQKVKMTNPDIYLRRRKNTLKLAAISWKKKSENKGKIKSAYGKFKLIKRSEKLLNHFILIDEIWNYLNPTRRLASDWGKGLEVVWAVDALTNRNFDELYDAEIAKSGFKRSCNVR